MKIKDSLIYNSFYDWINADFYKSDKNLYFDTLCVRDIFTFTFFISSNGYIKINQFSNFIIPKVKKFLLKSIDSLNYLPINQKPFIKEWKKKKYKNKIFMQPVIISFYFSCIDSKDYSAAGFLSFLTSDLEVLSYATKVDRMDTFDYNRLKPFDGVLLSPFLLRSPHIRSN